MALWIQFKVNSNKIKLSSLHRGSLRVNMKPTAQCFQPLPTMRGLAANKGASIASASLPPLRAANTRQMPPPSGSRTWSDLGTYLPRGSFLADANAVRADEFFASVMYTCFVALTFTYTGRFRDQVPRLQVKALATSLMIISWSRVVVFHLIRPLLPISGATVHLDTDSRLCQIAAASTN